MPMHPHPCHAPSAQVFQNGERWRVARNAWQPFFSGASLSKLRPLMDSSAQRLRSKLLGASAAGNGHPPHEDDERLGTEGSRKGGEVGGQAWEQPEAPRDEQEHWAEPEAAPDEQGQGGQVVDIWRELGLMTLDVVGTTAFG